MKKEDTTNMTVVTGLHQKESWHPATSRRECRVERLLLQTQTQSSREDSFRLRMSENAGQGAGMAIMTRRIVYLVIGQHALGVTGETLETRLIKSLVVNCPLAFLDVCCWKTISA